MAKDFYSGLNVLRGTRRFALKDIEIKKLKQYYIGAGFHEGLPIDSTLRDETVYENLDESEIMTMNFAFRTIKSLTAIETQWPMIEIPPPAGTRMGREKLDDFTQFVKEVIYGTYRRSEGIWGFVKNGFYKHMAGWSVMGAMPSLDWDRVQVRTYDPEWCYFNYEFGDETRLRDIYIAWREYPATVAELFPQWKGSGTADPTVEVCIYYDKTSKAIYCNGEFMTGVNHNYGFVPFVVIPNTIAPNGIPGMSDLSQIIGLNAEINKLISLWHEVLASSVRSNLHVFGQDDFPETRQVGKETVLLFKEASARAERSTPMGSTLPGVSWATNELHGTINEVAGTPGSLFGDQHGSYTSASGTGATLQGLSDSMDAGFLVQAERLDDLQHHILYMYDKHFADKEVNLYGMSGRQPFDVSFKGKDLKQHFRTATWYQPAMFYNASQRDTTIMQKQGAGLISHHTAMVMDGTLNPTEEMRRIHDEKIENANLEAEIMGIQQAAQMQAHADAGGQGMAADAARQRAQIEAGRTNPTKEGMFGGKDVTAPGAGAPLPDNSQPAPIVPPPAAGDQPSALPTPPVANPEEMQTLMAQRAAQPHIPAPIPSHLFSVTSPTSKTTDIHSVADAIRAVKKLKGRAFLVGRIIEFGKTANDIEIMLQNIDDKGTINNALRGQPFYGRIQYKGLPAKQVIPKEPYLEVTPGTTGYNREGDNFAANIPALGQPQAMPGGAGGAMPPPGMPGMTGGAIGNG